MTTERRVRELITTERLQNALDKQKRLEDALLEYIEKHKKNPPPEIAATIRRKKGHCGSIQQRV